MIIYYVSTTGSDDNTGISLDSSFATIVKAEAVAKPGDTVYVLGGTYKFNTKININCSGTIENPIVFKAYGQDRPIFDFERVKGLHPKEFAINFTPGTQYVIFDGFDICNSSASAIAAINCLGITIKNCIVHNIGHFGISIRSDECVVEYNEIYLIGTAWENCTSMGSWPQVVNTYFKPPVFPAVVGSYTYNNVFRGNYIYDCWGEGIDPIFGDGILIEDNIVRDVLSVGIYLDSTRNTVIRNNYIYSTNDLHNRLDTKVPLSGVFMGCEYFGCWSVNPPISHNENIQIYNNLFSRVSLGIGQWYDSLNTDYKNTYEKIKIYNNTIDTYNGTGDGIKFIDKGSIIPKDNECINNIIRAKSTIDIGNSMRFENNLWVNGIPSEGTHIDSYAGEPGWNNPQQGGSLAGYKLKDTSICIGKGQPIIGISHDICKEKRSNPTTLGAFEIDNLVKMATRIPKVQVDEVIPQNLPDFHVGINVLENSSFEIEVKDKKGIPLGWQSLGDTHAVSVVEDSFKEIEDPIYQSFTENRESRDPMNIISDSRFSLKLASKQDYKVYVYQTTEGIDNGRYGLHARVKRFGKEGNFYMESKDFGGDTIVCSVPEFSQFSPDHIDMGKKWFQLNMSDIMVTNGKCTVGFYAQGGPDNYVLIDEVWLYRY